MAYQDMQTECPSCHTVFAVSESDLGRAGGKVRCGDCLSIFNATENVHGAPPEPSNTPTDMPDESTASDSETIEPAALAPAPNDEEQAPTDDELAEMLEASYLIEVPEIDPSADESLSSSAIDEVEQAPTATEETHDEPDREQADVMPAEQTMPTRSADSEHYDDSGMFRFSDDTPAEVLDKELEALTAVDHAAETRALTGEQTGDAAEEAASNAAGDISNTETHVGDDWDDLLSELDDDFASTTPEASKLAENSEITLEEDADGQSDMVAEDAPDPEPVEISWVEGTGDTPLDFQLGESEQATPAATLDLDLTRTDDTDLSDAVEQHDELWLSPESTSADTVDDSGEPGDALIASEAESWANSDILDDVSAALAGEDLAPATETSLDKDSIADVIPIENEGAPEPSASPDPASEEDERFDKDALSSFLTAGDLFLADESSSQATLSEDDANTDEPAVTDAPNGMDDAQADIADSDSNNADDDKDDASDQSDAASAATSDNDDGKSASTEEPADSDDDEIAADNADGVQENAIDDDRASTSTDEPDIFADEPVEEIILSTESAESAEPLSQTDADLFAESMILSAETYQPRRRLWTTLSALAIIGLAVQAMHLNRGYLATTSPWNKIVTPVYDFIGIPITPDWDIRALCIQRSGSALGDTTLEIETLFQNQASRAMPLPLIKIDITDNFEDVIASTVVAPQDYLIDDEVAGTRLAAGERQMANVALSFTESRADKFELSLCYTGDAGQLRCGADICGTR